MKTLKCREIGVIFVGSFILATSIYFIQAQNNIADGGFLGIALIIKNLFDISPSVTTLFLDMPIILLAWKLIGGKMVRNTLIGSVSFSIFYGLLERFATVTIDLSNALPIAAVLGGVLVGIGLGLIMKFGGATGGDDVLTLIISKRSGLSIGKVYFVFDVIVISFSLFYMSWLQAAYTILSFVIASKVMDLIYYGRKPIKVPVPNQQKVATE